MPEALRPHSDVSEVLWYFSRNPEKERLTLRQDPHFYKRLPTSSEAYGGEFRMDPVQTFQHDRVSVLTDSSYRAVFLETTRRNRVFSNIWAVNGRIIFQGSFPSSFFFSVSDTLLGIHGSLEGDSVVGAAIHGIPNLWCSMEGSGLWDGPPLAPSPKVTPTQITSAAGVLIQDWTKPIREILRFPRANIHITDKQIALPRPGAAGGAVGSISAVRFEG